MQTLTLVTLSSPPAEPSWQHPLPTPFEHRVARAHAPHRRGSILIARASAIAATAALVLGLGALLVVEYALVWHVLFAPWVASMPAGGGW